MPNLLAVYAFGSRLTGYATVDSDLDLSVLVEGYADVVVPWELAGDIANIAGCDVDQAATIERCVRRAREEYDKNTATFITDHTRQDAAILNIQRACEAAIDMGHRG